MANTTIGGVEWVVDADVTPATTSINGMTVTTQKAEKSLKDVDKQAAKTSQTLKTKMTPAAKSTNAAMSGMGRSAGMAGIQMQQFIGQVQGGQSAMLALSQQSADLGFVLGAPLLGAIVGIGASIAGILLPNLLATVDTTEDLIEKLTELKKETELTSTQYMALAIAEQDNAAGIQDNIDAIHDELNVLDLRKMRLDEIIKRTEAGSNANEHAVAQLKEDRKERIKLNAALQTFTKEQEAATEASLKYNEAAITGEAITDKQQKAFDNAAAALDKFNASLTAQQKTIGMSARGVAHWRAQEMGATQDTHDQIDAIYDEIDANKDLQKQMKAYSQFADAMRSSEREKDKQDQEQRVKDRLASESKLDADRRRGTDFAEGITSGGMTDVQRVEMELEELNALRAQGLIDAELYQEALTQLEKDGVNARIAEQELMLGAASGAFGELATIFKDYEGEQSGAYKAMFALSKGFAVAQAGLNFATSISNASALPWPTNIPAIATAVTSGTSFLSAVHSATYSGREHGGGMAPNTAYEVGEKNKPELLMVGGNGGKMFSNAEMQRMMGGGSGGNLTVNDMTPSRNTYQETRSSNGDRVLTIREVDARIAAQSRNPASQMRQGLRQNTNMTDRAPVRRRNDG